MDIVKSYLPTLRWLSDRPLLVGFAVSLIVLVVGLLLGDHSPWLLAIPIAAAVAITLPVELCRSSNLTGNTPVEGDKIPYIKAVRLVTPPTAIKTEIKGVTKSKDTARFLVSYGFLTTFEVSDPKFTMENSVDVQKHTFGVPRRGYGRASIAA